MNRRIPIFFLLFILFFASCSGKNEKKNSTIETKQFTNPVYENDFPDPAILRTADGTFYAYATNGAYLDGTYANIRLLKSDDLVNWIECPDVLPTKAKWASKSTEYWAPHITHANGKYYLYFSATHDNGVGMGIGVAVSDTPEGPFIAEDEPIVYGESFEHIDPMVYIDPLTRKAYFYWGSAFKPIKVQELADNLLTFKEGSTPQDILFTSPKKYEILLEAPWLIYKDGYYYMFYSGDNCCGDKAHYAVLVARSTSPTGPFTTISEATGSEDNAILVENEYWLAPGHNSIIIDDNGEYWHLYHAINRDKKAPEGEDKYTAREFLIDKISWRKDGWPLKMTPTRTPTVAPFIK